MSDLMVEEYRFLRQEHETNRKFVFERPLLIVTAALAAALGLSEKGTLGLLPIPFLSVLAFNLWFTFNRLESSARIVAYIQLFHEGDLRRLPWIGWENALRQYRRWVSRLGSDRLKEPQLNDETRQFGSMAFYGPIFFFHVSLGISVGAFFR